ncbi:MAG: DoxX family membrane protein [Candidatus Pacebacteria bacterium]|nr:DoxX family membrane protein [Candidatus Paceibacterota bacterium]
MTQLQKVSLFLLRVSLGWVFFWAGITKVVNPAWSAGGFLQGAKTFPSLFHWFASPGMLPITNFVNEWGLLLLGVSLILGVFVRKFAPFGILLMILYYLPVLQFPYPNVNSFIVDEHIIYIISLITLYAFNAGHFWGLEKKVTKK